MQLERKRAMQRIALGDAAAGKGAEGGGWGGGVGGGWGGRAQEDGGVRDGAVARCDQTSRCACFPPSKNCEILQTLHPAC